MIPLLTPHPTLSALYKAIVANPQAADPRLQFADACEEIDDPHPSISAWGKFIKAQYALAAIGKPRYTIESVEIQLYGGPDYFRVGGAADDPIKVGDRIDVDGTHISEKRPLRLKPIILHGALVRKIVPTDSHGAVDFILKKDADSTPFPQKEYERLKDDCRYLFGNFGADWRERYGKKGTAFAQHIIPLAWSVASVQFSYELRMERGFVSEVRCFWRQWLKDATYILPRFPITKVHLNDTPIYSGRAHVEKGGPMGTFWFTPKGPRVTATMREMEGLPVEVERDRIRRALLAKHWSSVAEWELPPVAPTRWFGYDTADPAGPETP